MQGTLGPIPKVWESTGCLLQYLLCAFLSFSHFLMHAGQHSSLPELTRSLPQGMERAGSPACSCWLQRTQRWSVTLVLHSVTIHLPSSSMLWCLQVLTPTPFIQLPRTSGGKVFGPGCSIISSSSMPQCEPGSGRKNKLEALETPCGQQPLWTAWLFPYQLWVLVSWMF